MTHDNCWEIIGVKTLEQSFQPHIAVSYRLKEEKKMEDALNDVPYGNQAYLGAKDGDKWGLQSSDYLWYGTYLFLYTGRQRQYAG
jgi:hypothetical protein